MSQIVRITLTNAEEGTGPFNLFSNVDNFYNPFEGNLSLETLKAGYISTLVPDKATVIQVKSYNSICQTYLNLDIAAPSPSVTPSITPTVTTTPSVTPSLSPAAASPSSTPSITPTLTPSLTVTPSITPTLTPTPSVSPSALSFCQLKEYNLTSTGGGAVFTYYASCSSTGSTTATLSGATSSIICATELPAKTSGTGTITATGNYCTPTLVAIQLTALGANCSYANDEIPSNIAYVPLESDWFTIQNGKAKIKDGLTPPYLELPLYTSVEAGVTVSPYSVSTTATTFTVTDNTNQGTYGVILSSAANGTGMTLYIGYNATTGRKYITNRTICYY
jgi:hypothetical protein